MKSPTPTFGDNDFMANYSKVWQTLEPVLFWRDERYYGFHRWICSVLEDSCPGADRWGVLKLRSVIWVMSLQEQGSLLRRRSGCTRTQPISLPVTDPRALGEYYA